MDNYTHATATCRTEGCPVQGVAFPVDLYKNVDGALRAYCGKCGQQITDIQVDP